MDNELRKIDSRLNLFIKMISAIFLPWLGDETADFYDHCVNEKLLETLNLTSLFNGLYDTKFDLIEISFQSEKM